MDKQENTTVDGIKLERGRIYLRDKRNGRVFQYEEPLSNMSYIERFEYDGTMPDKPSLGVTKITLSGIEKAAEWDRLAAMSPEQREKELADRAAYDEEQRRLAEKLKAKTAEQNSDPSEYADDNIQLVDTGGPTLKAYRENKWTDEQLVDAGLATRK